MRRKLVEVAREFTAWSIERRISSSEPETPGTIIHTPGYACRRRWAGAFAIVACMVGCAPESPTGPTDAPLAPTITGIGVDFEAIWFPAWSVPQETRSEVLDAIQQANVAILLPTIQPGSESLRAELRITTTVPTQIPGVDLVLRRADGSVFVSVQTLPTDGEPICSPLTTNDLYPAWATTAVRGVIGCSLDGEFVSQVAWSESSQDFVTEFASDLDRSDLVSWLSTWEIIG